MKVTWSRYFIWFKFMQ